MLPLSLWRMRQELPGKKAGIAADAPDKTGGKSGEKWQP